MTPVAGRITRLEGTVQHYAWGSRTALAELRDRPSPTDTPEAELWFGAHHRGPARLLDGPSPAPLDAVIARRAEQMLGADVIQRFGPRLPLLLKVLAIDAPLSLQVHPDAAQAAAGFAHEESEGIALDAPERLFRDAWPKPELVIAHQPTEVLAGFRRASEVLATLDALAVPRLEPVRVRLEREGDRGLRGVLAGLLNWSRDQRALLTAEVATAAGSLARSGHPEAAHLRWLPRLHEQHHADPGVVVALLLRHLVLAPTEAVFLPAGNLHCYLHGVAIECMAASDNVLRGGLTPKHVDLSALLEMVDTSPVDDPRIAPAEVAGGLRYAPATGFFAVELLRPGREPVSLDDRGPQILLAMGPCVVAHGEQRVEMQAGEALFVAAGTAGVTAVGVGPLVRAGVGDPAHDGPASPVTVG